LPDPPDTKRGLSAPLLRSVVLTVLTRIGVLPLGLVQGAILARQLGPSGLGLYSALLVDVNMAVTLLSLGLPGALSVLVGERPTRLRALWFHALGRGVFLVVPALLVSAAALLWPGLPRRLDRLPGEIALVSVSACVQYLRDVLSSLLLGTQQFHAQNVQALLIGGFQLLLCIGFYLSGRLDPHTAVAIQIISNAALCLLSGAALRLVAREHGLWRPQANPDDTDDERSLPRRALAIGWRNFLHIVPDILLMRIDVYLIQRLLHKDARQQLGLYQAGVRIAELVLMVPGTLNAVLFAKAAARENLTQATLFGAKMSLYLGLLCLLGMALFGQPLLIAFYGARFAGSFAPCLWVLFGCCALCFSNPQAGTLSGAGAYPKSVIVSQGAALLLNVGANLYLIPRHGALGAALASTISYGLSAAIISLAFARRFSVPLRDLLRPVSPRLLLQKVRQSL
jgi:O-antigen/teichoic acid export membrane protein